MMNKTKTIVTIGPSSKDINVIKSLILNGADVIRLNLSHADHEFCKDIIEKVNKVDKELGKYTSIMFDTNGPSVRIGKIASSHAFLKNNDLVRIYMKDITGDSTKFSVNYNDLIDDLSIGSVIKVADGAVEIQVEDKDEDEKYLICRVLKEGIISSNATLNVPTTRLNIPFLSKKDKEDIKFADEMNIDYLALSFVSTIEDVLEVNDMLIELGNDHIAIVSKLENEQAIDNLDDILSVSEGIMIARSDLGVEIPIERVPGIQKMVISKCHIEGKISIVATEMMTSMENSLTPTKAEISDIANAVLDGCDAVMLSDETTIGKYPVETLSMMERVIRESEYGVDYLGLMDKATRSENKDITGIIAHSVIDGSNRIKASAIITPTNSGYTARKMSRFRPACPIIAVSPNIDTVKSLNLYYGVVPTLVKEFDSLDRMIKESRAIAIDLLKLEEKDKIIITGGYPFKDVKHTNFMKIEEL